LERKPRVRPLVSRHDEDGHSGIRGTHETTTLVLRQPGVSYPKVEHIKAYSATIFLNYDIVKESI
jgi:hypothetical protein